MCFSIQLCPVLCRQTIVLKKVGAKVVRGCAIGPRPQFSNRGEIMTKSVLKNVAKRFGGKLRALAFVALVMTAFAPYASAQDDAKVKEAMATLKSSTAALGAPKLDGENLFFGATKINDNFDVVDAVKAKHSGTATLFVKKGASFVRVSTNVIKEGKRAVGTQLDPSGPAYAAVKDGKSFYGIVDILGKMYTTGYEPIKAEGGDVIGVYYVGYAME